MPACALTIEICERIFSLIFSGGNRFALAAKFSVFEILYERICTPQTERRTDGQMESNS